MSFKSRKLSLDTLLCLDGNGNVLGGRRGSSRFSSKKSKQSLDDAQPEVQKLNHSLNSTVSLREQAVTQDGLEQSDEPNNHSLLKHNKSFHKLFQEIPEEEKMTHTFTCALQKEVLYHGRLFVSSNYVCFYSSVLLKDTKVVIPVSTIKEVKNHNSALSILSIQTVDEKHLFVSVRNRDTCYKLLQTIRLKAQSSSGSPHLSFAENEADNELIFSSSSLEDSIDYDLSQQSTINLGHSFPQMSSDDYARSNSTRQNSLSDENDTAVSWIWRAIEKITSIFLNREIGHLHIFFYIYMMLMVLLLLALGHIGLRIIALEEKLNYLGALTEWSPP
ncbi:GRAM domain-containing protein 2B-like isoform X2 [Channa argus]|uniref:GRAM domain-containing protein 2B-like isoform X2 n=1 Tax=Channa argus TaxID=215402 RepID=UPI0035230ABC